MDGACDKYGEERKCRGLVWKSEGNSNLENLDVNDRILLKLILNRV
jgi:hypothetical protein